MSDGQLEPADVARAAVEAGVTTMSLTDHDGVAGVSAATEVAEAAGIVNVPGVELSCVHRYSEDLHICGYWLARPPEEITLADVIRAVEGPLANIQDSAPEETSYAGHAERLREVWIAVRASLRAVLENVTLADVTAGRLPRGIEKLASDPDAWVHR